MGKIEHLQFLALLIPTFLILAAAAVSMADLAVPADDGPSAVALNAPVHPGAMGCDDGGAE